MTSSIVDENLIPIDVHVDDEMIRVRFSGGLETATPVALFPRLKNASPEQRLAWRLIGRGEGVHWPGVDEDISVRGLIENASTPARSTLSQVA